MLLKTAYKMKPPVSARINSRHPLADKLVACYLFNEGSGVIAYDASGCGHHGTLTGGVTRAIGKFGRAVDFDGTDGYIVIADHDDFTSVKSISVWIYMRNASSFAIVFKGIYRIDGEWMLNFGSGGDLGWAVIDESAGAYVGRKDSTDYRISFQNRWLHVVVTYDGGDTPAACKVYRNAVQCDDANHEAGSGFSSVENLGGTVEIGRWTFTTPDRYADGVIDHLMMWRRILTPSDIVKLRADSFCMFEKPASLLSRVIW